MAEFLFEVMSGHHIEKTPTGYVLYPQGSIVKTGTDLALLDLKGMVPKFRRIGYEPAHPSQGIHIASAMRADDKYEVVDKPPPMEELLSCERFVDGSGKPKFKIVRLPVSASVPQAQPKPGVPSPGTPLPTTGGDNYESMSVKDLQAVAAEEEIDLKGAGKKEDIIRVIRLRKQLQQPAA